MQLAFGFTWKFILRFQQTAQIRYVKRLYLATTASAQEEACAI